MRAAAVAAPAADLAAVSLVGRYTRSNPATTEPWATMVAENTPGAAPIGVPFLVNQGDADTLVRPTDTAKFVAQACATGEYVVAKNYPGQTHATIALVAIPTVTTFFTAVLAGTPPPSTC